MSVLTFLIKAVIVLVAILIILAFAMKDKMNDKLSVKNLNKKFKSYKNILRSQILSKKELKKTQKQEQKKDKATDPLKQPKSYVLQFNGDIKASAVDQLRETITAVLSVATPEDEVVLCLESPGGMVHGYGLAASQLQRIKDQGLRLVVCVDKVAASGGYMMACLADHIIAAPFAIIGSVGVLAQVPNFNKILKKNDVDYYQVTAGKYKRTLTLLGEVTDEGLNKFKEDIEDTHQLFKSHVGKFRTQVDVEQIATGEHWYGQKALELKLVDALGTSDDYLFKQSQTHQLREITYQGKKSLKEKLADGVALSIEKVWDKVWTQLNRPL